MAAMRELFEETNILIGNPYPFYYDYDEIEGRVSYNDLYSSKYDSNFLLFCQNMNLQPLINKLYGFTRKASPVGYYPAIDT